MDRKCCLLSAILVCLAPPLWAQSPSKDLPRYDVDVSLDTTRSRVDVREIVTWTNVSQQAVTEIVFNAHARYSIPDKDIGLLAKMAEVLRLSPKESMSFKGPPLEVREVRYRGRMKTVGAPTDNTGTPFEKNKDPLKTFDP